jgi:NTE family protein
LTLHLSVLLRSQIIDIPLGLETDPTGNDSFVLYHRMNKPRIALALSGGGARGLAQIGVLEVFEKHHIPIHAITGTSMGAIIGGLYAIGYSALDLDSLARQIEWNQIIQDTPPRQSLFMAEKAERSRHLFQLRFHGLSVDIQNAFTSGMRFNQLLTKLIWKAPFPVSIDFDQLIIPFRAVSSDLLTGHKVVISEGSLVEALRASMAIPLLFTPVKRDNAWLVDGGLVQNLPVEEARNMGADLVIAVDTSSKLRSSTDLEAPWEVADQVTTIMSRESIDNQYRMAEVGIQPQLDGFSNTDFSQISALISAGTVAAETAIPKIETLIDSWDQAHINLAYTIHQINIRGCRLQPEDSCFKRLDLDLSRPVSGQMIRSAARSLYDSGHFTGIRAFLDTAQQCLTFEVEETPLIKAIVINGNHEYSDSTLLSLMETETGKPIHIQKGKTDCQRILSHYQKAGFTLIRFRSKYIANQVLYLNLNEGRLDKISIDGLKLTKPFVIQREIGIFPGELFNIQKVDDCIQNIFSTGYFKDVRFEVITREEDYELVFHVTELQYTIARFGLRYDLERKTKTFLDIVQDNILGIGAVGTLSGLLGSRDQGVVGTIRANRLYKSYLTSKFELGYNYSKYIYYQQDQELGEYTIGYLCSQIGIGRQIQRFGTVSLELRSCGYDLHADPDIPLSADRNFIQTLCIRSEVDTRDQMPFPNHGKYHLFEYETSSRFLGSNADFMSLSSLMESYYSLNRNWLFHPKVIWGTAGHGIPFFKWYRMGGLNSFMGLPENEYVGKRQFLFSGEIRYSLPVGYFDSYISVRYDFGGIWDSYAKINQNDFKHGIGLICSIKTPLGPFIFAAGRMSDGYSRVYLSMGHPF